MLNSHESPLRRLLISWRSCLLCQIGLVPIGQTSDIFHIPPQGISSDRIEGNFRITHMARPTHIAVNLLLIVAVTMQPSLAYGLQQDCSAGVSTGYTCQGCGCCKVQSETAKCPCCSGEATTEEDGCCGHGHKSQHRRATFADDPFDGMELKEGPIPVDSVPVDAEQPLNDHAKQKQVAEFAVLAAACHCVTAPEPFNAPVPHSPVTELRDVLTVNIACVVDVATSVQPPLSGCFESARRPIEPHFSQIAFCVWRL